MGFTIAGYPTRHHKRRMLPHPDKRPVYYHHLHHWFGNDTPDLRSNKRTKLSDRQSESASPSLEPQLYKHKTVLQDLPPEIIQRIFVLANDVTALPLVSKFFYHCLKPSNTLLHQIICERFLFDPHRFGIHKCMDSGALLASPELFDHPLFARYFLHNFSYFDTKIDAFAPKSMVPHFHDTNLPPGFVFDIGTLGRGEFDLPVYFYHNFAAVFADPHVLGRILRYFTGADMSMILDNGLRYFLEEQSQLQVDSLAAFFLEVLQQLRITRTFITSAHPLHTTLISLFLVPGLNMAKLHPAHRDGSPVPEEDQQRLKHGIVRQLLLLFYGPENPHAINLLSNPDLWRVLHDISDIKLIDIFEKFGAVGQYNFA